MNKAIFLDRDGTINVEKHYLYKIEDFEFLPGVIEGLKRLQNMGFVLIVITNQSGIARGLYTEDDCKKVNTYMLSCLESQGVHISKVYYCPHLLGSKIRRYNIECECRKPKLGLFYQAQKDFDIDLSLSWAIGDKERDCSICKETGCRGVIVSNKNKIDKDCTNIYFADDFEEAVNYILNTK